MTRTPKILSRHLLAKILTCVAIAGTIAIAFHPLQMGMAKIKKESPASVETPAEEDAELMQWWNEDINAPAQPVAAPQKPPAHTGSQPSVFMERNESDKQPVKHRFELPVPTPSVPQSPAKPQNVQPGNPKPQPTSASQTQPSKSQGRQTQPQTAPQSPPTQTQGNLGKNNQPNTQPSLREAQQTQNKPQEKQPKSGQTDSHIKTPGNAVQAKPLLKPTMPIPAPTKPAENKAPSHLTQPQAPARPQTNRPSAPSRQEQAAPVLKQADPPKNELQAPIAPPDKRKDRRRNQADATPQLTKPEQTKPDRIKPEKPRKKKLVKDQSQHQESSQPSAKVEQPKRDDARKPAPATIENSNLQENTKSEPPVKSKKIKSEKRKKKDKPNQQPLPQPSTQPSANPQTESAQPAQSITQPAPQQPSAEIKANKKKRKKEKRKTDKPQPSPFNSIKEKTQAKPQPSQSETKPLEQKQNLAEPENQKSQSKSRFKPDDAVTKPVAEPVSPENIHQAPDLTPQKHTQPVQPAKPKKQKKSTVKPQHAASERMKQPKVHNIPPVFQTNPGIPGIANLVSETGKPQEATTSHEKEQEQRALTSKPSQAKQSRKKEEQRKKRHQQPSLKQSAKADKPAQSQMTGQNTPAPATAAGFETPTIQTDTQPSQPAVLEKATKQKKKQKSHRKPGPEIYAFPKPILVTPSTPVSGANEKPVRVNSEPVNLPKKAEKTVKKRKEKREKTVKIRQEKPQMAPQVQAFPTPSVQKQTRSIQKQQESTQAINTPHTVTASQPETNMAPGKPSAVLQTETRQEKEQKRIAEKKRRKEERKRRRKVAQNAEAQSVQSTKGNVQAKKPAVSQQSEKTPQAPATFAQKKTHQEPKPTQKDRKRKVTQLQPENRLKETQSEIHQKKQAPAATSPQKAEALTDDLAPNQTTNPDRPTGRVQAPQIDKVTKKRLKQDARKHKALASSAKTDEPTNPTALKQPAETSAEPSKALADRHKSAQKPEDAKKKKPARVKKEAKQQSVSAQPVQHPKPAQLIPLAPIATPNPILAPRPTAEGELPNLQPQTPAKKVQQSEKQSKKRKIKKANQKQNPQPVKLPISTLVNQPATLPQPTLAGSLKNTTNASQFPSKVILSKSAEEIQNASQSKPGKKEKKKSKKKDKKDSSRIKVEQKSQNTPDSAGVAPDSTIKADSATPASMALKADRTGSTTSKQTEQPNSLSFQNQKKLKKQKSKTKPLDLKATPAQNLSTPSVASPNAVTDDNQARAIVASEPAPATSAGKDLQMNSAKEASPSPDSPAESRPAENSSVSLNSPASITEAEKLSKAAQEQPAESAQSKAAVYAAAFHQWQQSAKPQRFDPIFVQGQEAASTILKTVDSLDEAQFEALREQMPGYLMLRNEIIVVAPDPAFFKDLMKKHGTPVDIAFFNLMSDTLNGYWPTTMEQRTDLSGCTRFGSQDLVRLYGDWTGFRKRYPGAYREALQDPNLPLLADIEDQLLNSKAACDGPSSVIEELKSFILRYPQSELTPKIRKRLQDIQRSEFDMVFYQGVKYNPEH